MKMSQTKIKRRLSFILFLFFAPAALANDKCRELFSDLENPLESARPLVNLTPESASNYEPETAQQNSGWISLAKAKALVREKGIRSKAELEQGRQSGLLPTNFPPKPHITYKDSDWQSYDDFLSSNWMSFEEAKALMQTEGIENIEQFNQWSGEGKRPDNFPPRPEITYKDSGWQGYRDFFYSGWMSLEEAKALMRTKGITTHKQFIQWKEEGKQPNNFPSSPHIAYKDSGWKGYPDFLGSGWMPFEEAKALMQTEGIQTKTQFEQWNREGNRPNNFPSNPAKAYKDSGWQGFGDFLGSRRTRSKNWMPFEEAKALMRAEGIETQKQFFQWSREGNRPNNFPSAPDKVYKDSGWKGYPDFLGSGWSRSKNWMTYEEAKALIQEKGIETYTQFRQWSEEGNRPDNFPSDPAKVYKDSGWKGYRDFLGARPRRSKNWMSLEEAKALMQTEGITTFKQFRQWNREGKRPDNFPSDPAKVYKDSGWQGYGDFLGSGRTHSKNWIPFEEAKALMRKKGITTRKQFRQWSKEGNRPDNFPSEPNIVYKDSGWKGYRDFLGSRRTRSKIWMPFEEAKALMRAEGIETQKQFFQWSREGNRPDNFPSDPAKIYKDSGWKGFGDFLGSGRTRSKNWIPFEEAKAFIQTEGIETARQFEQWSREGNRPDNFPSDPAKIYKDSGWKGFGDFLGSGRTRSKKLDTL